MLISFQVLSHICKFTDTAPKPPKQQEAIGADPGMDVPSEALILTGPKQTWGSELFPKIV